MGKDSSDGKKAVKFLDNHIDKITGPLLEPTLKMFAAEGNPFLSSYDGSTQLVVEAQNYIAGDLAKPHTNLTAKD